MSTQQPEAFDLADWLEAVGGGPSAKRCAALLREQHARIAELESELEAIGAGGVQALSAGPMVTSEQRRLIGVIAEKIEDGTLFQSGIYQKKDLARFVRNMLDTTPTAPAASPTPPAEQQAAATEGYVQPVHDKCDRITWRGRYYHLPLTEQDAPKAAPQQESTASNESAYQRGYMDGMAKGRRDAETAPQQEVQEPTEIPEEIERMAADRYKVVPSHESMFHRWAVVAGTGTQQLYLGREVECQNMARKFAGAFLDGAFVAMQSTSPNPAPAPLSESEYKRGYRDGYDRRDAEVQGALV